MKSKFAFKLLALATTTVITMTCVQGAPFTWDGGAGASITDDLVTPGTGIWTTGGGNWDNGIADSLNAAWANGDDATFGGTAGTVTISGGVNAHNLTFDSSYTIAGSTLTLSGTTPTAPTITTASGVSAIIESVINGTAGLIKAGNGTLTLSGNNNYSGGTTVNAGTLKLDLSARSGVINSLGAFSVAGGGILELFNTATTPDNITLQNSAFSGSGTINKTGAGSLSLHTGSSLTGFSGTINVNQGTLAVNNLGGNAGTAGATVNIASEATFDVRYISTLVIDKLTGSGTLDHSYAATASVTVGANNGSSTFNGAIKSTGGTGANALTLTKSGTGMLTLTGASTYTGATTVSQGVLKLDLSTNTTGVLASTSALTLGGGTLMVQGKSTGASTQTLGNLTLTANTSSTIAINSNGGTGTTFTLGSTWTRNTTGSVFFDLSAGTPATAVVASSPSLTNGIVGGWATIKDNSGTGFATISSGKVVRYTGGTVLTGASDSSTTNFTTTPTDPDYASGTLTLSAITHNANTLAIATGPGGTLDLNAQTFALATNGGLLIEGSGHYTIQNGTISGTGAGLAKFGTGTLTLSGANTFTGATTVNGGTLKVTDLASYRSSTVIASGANFEANVATNVNAANNFNITGTGTLIKTGTGTWLIGNVGRVGIAMGAGGLIDIREGILATGGHQNSFTGNLASLNIATNATLDLIGENGSFDALTGSGTVTNNYINSITLTVGAANGGGTFSGTIQQPSGSVNLVKTGSGTETLTGANSYGGGTAINGGALVVNNTTGSGTGSGAVTVNNANTRLKGTGTISGATTINAGAIHAAGDGVGTQKFTGNLTYADASIFEWEIDRTQAQTRGTGYDAVNVTGTLAGLDGTDAGTTLDAKFRVVIGDSDFSNAFWDTDKTWTDIFTAANGTTAKTNWANIFGGGFEYYYNNGTTLAAISPTGQGSFALSGNTLTWSAVPEPTGALAGILLGLSLLHRRVRPAISAPASFGE